MMSCQLIYNIIVFTWFVNLVSTFGAITWMCIVWSHLYVPAPMHATSDAYTHLVNS